MKKNVRGIIGIMMSASMIMSPVMQAMASNQFDVQAEDVAGSVLFPGDSVSGTEPVYLGPDGEVQGLSEGAWTNRTAQAYEMSGMEGEEGGLWLQPVGYVLTVNGGTSRLTGTDGTDTSNHYRAKDGSSEEKKDIAYYEAWSDVTVQAADPGEGKVFDHWQIDSANVSLTDASASGTNFTMAEAAVVLTAVYADAPADVPEESPAEGLEEIPEGNPAEGLEEIPEENSAEQPEIHTESQIDLLDGLDGEAAPEGSSDTDPDVITIGDNGEEAGNENGVQDSLASAYTLTVENGAGSGEYEVGEEVAISAEIPEGMVFTGWTTDAVSVWFRDSSSPQTTFPMPAEAVTVTANYEAAAPELYTVQVENGEGGGSYEAGSAVFVMADEAPEGMEFAGWSVSENVALDNAGSMEAWFTMPSQDVVLTANYVPAETESEDIPEEESTEEWEEEEYTEAGLDPAEPEIIETEEYETEAAETEVIETEAEETEAETEALGELETEAEEESETEAES
ncbi:MAG: hypothetical protein Q4E91_02505, partial [Lachnospiraceae bacterium]|nr:hypothetical protein [Lachnospiraceae bacterium]